MTRVKMLLAMLALAVSATGIGFAVGQQTTEEVRVVARSLADGRIEFGIEHNGERLLPRGRYMGEDQISAYNGRWLRSTPATIEIEQGAQKEALALGRMFQGSGDGTRTAHFERGVYLCFADVGEDSPGSWWAHFYADIKFGNWDIDNYAFRWSDDEGEAHWTTALFEAQQAGEYTFKVNASDAREWAITCYRAPR